MLFPRNKPGSDAHHPHAIATVRDIVEIVAILAAGIWAFYVFAYENRIKPALANPDVDVAASIQRIGRHNGLSAIGLRVRLHNIGTVRAHFLAMAVNVYGQRVMETQPSISRDRNPLGYNFNGYYRTGPKTPLFTYAYVTQLGNPATKVDTALDPGMTIENYRTFYVPDGRFDLLTVGIDTAYTKFDLRLPTRLVIGPQGDARVAVDASDTKYERYNISSMTSLDMR